MNIKEWYEEAFPTDKLGKEINETASFEGFADCLDEGENIYEYIGVADSVIRERIFEKLAEIVGVNYEVIYQEWLVGGNCR